ncbi:hypothetical protein [Acuticoccus kandeliae]|uniref:hypothetical protein n=1 Tax=Acuticoccus kandeliae TaxID=2073160 RepID=UPI000D3ECB2F|nr:hypothetical protein [Acuticoccus kandeliae]
MREIQTHALYAEDRLSFPDEWLVVTIVGVYREPQVIVAESARPWIQFVAWPDQFVTRGTLEECCADRRMYRQAVAELISEEALAAEELTRAQKRQAYARAATRAKVEELRSIPDAQPRAVREVA